VKLRFNLPGAPATYKYISTYLLFEFGGSGVFNPLSNVIGRRWRPGASQGQNKFLNEK